MFLLKQPSLFLRKLSLGLGEDVNNEERKKSLKIGPSPSLCSNFTFGPPLLLSSSATRFVFFSPYFFSSIRVFKASNTLRRRLQVFPYFQQLFFFCGSCAFFFTWVFPIQQGRQTFLSVSSAPFIYIPFSSLSPAVITRGVPYNYTRDHHFLDFSVDSPYYCLFPHFYSILLTLSSLSQDPMFRRESSSSRTSSTNIHTPSSCRSQA